MKKVDAYNKDGRKIITSIQRDNYIIDIVKQESTEKTLDDLYQVIAKLMYKEAIQKQIETYTKDDGSS